jgi:hypothetical protein
MSKKTSRATVPLRLSASARIRRVKRSNILYSVHPPLSLPCVVNDSALECHGQVECTNALHAIFEYARLKCTKA